MGVVNVRELHLRTGAIVDRVAQGEVVTIERRGATVAELRPAKARHVRPLPDRTKLLARYPQLHGDSGRFLEEDRS
jgi:antitoxin (DNA-binding transcriptional repressor) of toxin-antitoxin stability system